MQKVDYQTFAAQFGQVPRRLSYSIFVQNSDYAAQSVGSLGHF